MNAPLLKKIFENVHSFRKNIEKIVNSTLIVYDCIQNVVTTVIFFEKAAKPNIEVPQEREVHNMNVETQDEVVQKKEFSENQ